MTAPILLAVLFVWSLVSVAAALLIGPVINRADRICVDPVIRPRRQRRLRRAA